MGGKRRRQEPAGQTVLVKLLPHPKFSFCLHYFLTKRNYSDLTKTKFHQEGERDGMIKIPMRKKGEIATEE